MRKRTTWRWLLVLGLLLAGTGGTWLQAQDRSPLLSGGIIDILDKGGVVMILILAGSVVGLALTFERLVALRRSVLLPRQLLTALRQAAEARDAAGIFRLVEKDAGPLARIVAAGLSRRPQGVQEVERVMETVGGREVARLKRPIRPLAILATVEPLLGLLGTVLGMIGTFNVLHHTSAAERVQKLAPGIGQALYTTVGGLCTAIPFVILYHLLVGRVNRAADEWSAVGSEIVLALDHSPSPEGRSGP